MLFFLLSLLSVRHCLLAGNEDAGTVPADLAPRGTSIKAFVNQDEPGDEVRCWCCLPTSASYVVLVNYASLGVQQCTSRLAAERNYENIHIVFREFCVASFVFENLCVSCSSRLLSTCVALFKANCMYETDSVLSSSGPHNIFSLYFYL